MATTVIEVGVDVPNASLMIIENAERLGLAQLHQCVGASGEEVQHHFVLMYKSPLGKVSTAAASDARKSGRFFDLGKRFRNSWTGRSIGTKQTGIAEFKVANLMRDRKMIP